MNHLLAITTENLLLSGLGYLIVFSVLVMLFLVFRSLPKLLGSITHIQAKAKEMGESLWEGEETATKPEVLTGEVNAAIAMALHLYLHETHDEEALNLTIKQIKKRYSPWSSKIYGVQNQPSRTPRAISHRLNTLHYERV